MHDDGYIFFRVNKIVRETAYAITLELINTDYRKIEYRSGQFLTFIFEIRGEEIRRSYSISSAPGWDENISVTIKRILPGKISEYIFENIHAGSVIKSLPPAGRMLLNYDESEHDIFLIAAGSGITPLFSIIKSALINLPLSNITLIYSNRNENETIFREQLLEIQEEYKNRFTCIFIWSETSDKKYKYPSHLNTFLIEQLINANIKYGREQAEYFLCGPFSFMRMAQIKITAMGFNENHIYKENFVIQAEQEAINTPPSGIINSDSWCTIKIKNTELSFKIPPQTTILKAAMNNNIHLPYSCMSGICGTCAAKCKSGKVLMSDNQVLTDKDLKEGWVLTCVGYAATAEVDLEVV